MELSVSYGLWKLNELRSETRVFPTFYFNFLIIMYIIFLTIKIMPIMHYAGSLTIFPSSGFQFGPPAPLFEVFALNRRNSRRIRLRTWVILDPIMIFLTLSKEYIIEMFYLNIIEKLFLYVEQLDQLGVGLPFIRLLTGVPIPVFRI